METTVAKKHWFAGMAQITAKMVGSSTAFIVACVAMLAWLATGPLFHWSNAWQLVINTVTNIVSVLMLFLIQNTQNRDSSAIQLKLDELLRAMRGAQNSLIKIEDLTEADLERIKQQYTALAAQARNQTGPGQSPAVTPTGHDAS